MDEHAFAVVFRNAILTWFDTHKRQLPWRNRRTPYRVWISEIMLQQTRVDQATPYFRRFIKTFPSLRSLANADIQEVLKAWEGLGYYRRAKHLHQTAQQIQTMHRGRFPRTYAELIQLPGIGPYTAAAISSLCFDVPEGVVDGNVIRVLSRIKEYPAEVGTQEAKEQFKQWMNAWLDPRRPGAFNEAMMELGAVVCTPKNPACDACPIGKAGLCQVVNHHSDPHRFPVKKKKQKIPTLSVGAGIVYDKSGRMLIAQRPENKMLGGLWEFPGGKQQQGESIQTCIRRELNEELGIDVKVETFLLKVKHAYTHFKLDMDVYRCSINKGSPKALECEAFAWVTLSETATYPFSKADLKIIEYLKEQGSQA